jgi:23S rRNA (cytosine1962-C5)-methyltransferase
MGELILKAGREKSLRRRHPWIFSGAVGSVSSGVQSGATVTVRTANGEFLAHAAFSPQSQIAGRVWSFRDSEVIDAAFFAARIRAAVQARSAIGNTNALRLIHAESDGLPGVMVDRYGDVLVAQFLTAGAELWRETIIESLVSVTGVANVFERSDADVRTLEGLDPRTGVLRGAVAEAPLVIEENGLKFGVDVRIGHKTGFYIDQRDNRDLVRQLAAGRDVLNCFCYTGAFSIAALAGGARHALSIDSSGPALVLGAENVGLNGIDGAKSEWMEADVFAVLRLLRDKARAFDLIVLDPPKFAPTVQFVEKAARAYKDINLLAFKLLRPGGLLATFSCSGGVSPDLFQKIVAGAALDAGTDAQILKRLGPGEDHPVALNFPEGDYLKGLLIRRL